MTIFKCSDSREISYLLVSIPKKVKLKSPSFRLCRRALKSANKLSNLGESNASFQLRMQDPAELNELSSFVQYRAIQKEIKKLRALRPTFYEQYKFYWNHRPLYRLYLWRPELELEIKRVYILAGLLLKIFYFGNDWIHYRRVWIDIK